MRSIKFPKMFSSNSTNTWRSSEHARATMQNARLTLLCEKGELFGDPYFGVNLKHYLFEQNNYILRDIIIDTIYNQLALFVPQIRVERQNIEIIQHQTGKKAQLICSFTGINQITFEPDTYNLVLYEEAANNA